MKRNSKKLVSALIAIIAILSVIIIFAPKTRENLNLNLELGNGYQLVYKTDNIKQETVKETAEVLKKRISNFGAVDVEYEIENDQIVLSYTGIEDNDTLRKYLPMIGKVSFRDYDNKELMDRAVLNADRPFAVAKNEDKTLLYIFVGDSKEFSANTLMLSMAEKKYMVVWVDYDESLTYEKEQSKTNPAYLASASVSQAISDTCYIQSAHDYETTRNIVATVNGGELPCSIEEVSFVAMSSIDNVDGASVLVNSMWAIVAFAAVILVCKYYLAGLVSSLMLVLYQLTVLATVSAFGVIFDSIVAILILFGLVIGIYVLFVINDKINDQLNIGLLEETALKNAYQKYLSTCIEAYLSAIIAGAVCYLFLRTYFAGFAITLLTVAVFGLCILVLWNKFMLTDLLTCSYFDKKLFGYNEKKKEYKEINFAVVAESKFLYVIVALLIISALLFIVSVKDNIKVLLFALIPLVVSTVITCCYFAYKNKKVASKSLTITSLLILALTTSAIYLSKYTGQENIGFMFVMIAMMIVLAILVIKNLTDNYDLMLKNKLTDAKIKSLFNKVLSSTLKNFVISVVASIAFVIVLNVLDLKAKALLALLLVISSLLTIVFASSLWLQYSLKNYHQPKRKNKKSSEKSERVIFGIND